MHPIMSHLTEVGQAIARIRKFFRQRAHVTLGGFARRANLHRNTLYGLEQDTWNPQADTLQRCLQLIKEIEAKEARAAKRKGRPNGQRATAAA